MRQGAVQHLRVHMETGAHFCLLPYPVVPHKASIFEAHNRLYLQKDCTLIWGEVLTCGRKGCGEVFQFSRYRSKTEIYLEGRMVVKENLLLQPSFIPLQGIGQLEGYTHQATFIYIDVAADVEKLRASFVLLLKEVAGVAFGISLLPVKGFIIRLLDDKGEQLYNLLNCVAKHISAHATLYKDAIHTPLNEPVYDA